MELFGIGPLELLFILVLALIIFGPRDLDKIGKSIGQGLNKLVRSDIFKTVRQASNKIKTLPEELMRSSGLDEVARDLNGRPSQPPPVIRSEPKSHSDESQMDEPSGLTQPKTHSAGGKGGQNPPPAEKKFSK